MSQHKAFAARNHHLCQDFIALTTDHFILDPIVAKKRKNTADNSAGFLVLLLMSQQGTIKFQPVRIPPTPPFLGVKY